MTTEQIDIRIREDGAVVVKRNIENIAPAATRSADAVDFLKRALAALGGALAVREVLRLVDTFTNLQNRLRSTGLEGVALNTVYAELLRTSNATRSSLEGSVELYARLAISSKELGVSQRQLIDFTTSLNQAITLSGASAQEAQAGLIQLSQGMASGTLRGDELRSVLEQLPAVADVIAKSMGVTRGQLRQLGEDGKITAQTILKAFQQARGELAERFGKTLPTLGQSFQVLKNNVLDYVGQLDKSIGASAALSRVLLFISNNIDTIAKVLAGLLAGLVLLGGAALLVNGLSAAFVALKVAIATNPIGFFLVAMTSAIALLTLFSDRIGIGLDSVTTLADFLQAFGAEVQTVFTAVVDTVAGVVGPIGSYIRSAFSTDATFAGFLRAVAGVVDLFTGLWRGAVGFVLQLFISVPPAIKDLFLQGLNAVLTLIGEFTNKAGDLLNEVAKFAGQKPFVKTFDFTLPNDVAGSARNLGADLVSAFDEGVKNSDGATTFVNKVLGNAQALGQARSEAARLAARFPAQVSTVAPPAAKVPVDPKELEKAQNALRGLLDRIKPSAGAVLELAKAEKVLSDAQKVGLITQQQKNEYLALTRKYYEDQIDPLGKINRELTEQADLLSITARERGIETELLKTTNEFRQQGIPLTEEETNALRLRLQALRDYNELVQAQDSLLANSVGKRQQFVTQLQAINNLLANPSSGFTKGDAAQEITAIAPDLFAGTDTQLEAQVARFQDMYAQIQALRDADLINEQTASVARARIAIQENEIRLQGTRDFFGNLATLASSGNKKLAAIGKAAAISQATIDGVLAVQKAYAAPPGWPYNAPNVIAVGVAAAANVAKIAGFEKGGYTGNLGTGQVAGVVHGQEFVVNAAGTRKNRAVLEAMNNGSTVAPGAAGALGQNVNVIVNVPAGDKVERQERVGPNGKEIELTIRRVVASDIRSGGGISTALEGQYGLSRAAGAPR